MRFRDRFPNDNVDLNIEDDETLEEAERATLETWMTTERLPMTRKRKKITKKLIKKTWTRTWRKRRIHTRMRDMTSYE
ncbi:hypothetical protein APHAL10511_002854, partial [Amanita phalloides]